MKLQVRVTLTAGLAFVLLWGAATTWMLLDLRQQTMKTLDQRLVSTAAMVANLVKNQPAQSDSHELSEQLRSVLNQSGTGLACHIASLQGNVMSSNLQSTASPQPPGFGHVDVDNKAWRTYTLLDGSRRITIADQLSQRQQLEQDMLVTAAAPPLVALLISLSLLWFITGQSLRPITRLSHAIQSRDSHDLRPISLSPLPVDLQPLLRSQNQLLNRLKAALEREKRLTNDIAHELRTPLTGIKTNLQAAAMVEGTDKITCLQLAESGADRLHQILEQLLLLARLGDNATRAQHRCQNPNTVIQAVLHDFGTDAGRIHIEQGPGTADNCPLPAPLLDIICRNLLENALKHGRGQVKLRLQGQPGQWCLAVQDEGSGVAQPALSKLTQRFWRQGDQQGCGLGLAIVSAIVQQYQGQLEANNHPQGFEISIRLPVANSGAGENGEPD
ncbi:sensor histidine kinase [Bowmanella pacifica]|uniref:histidine kinase n=1 Tax=Bowmanella pacifica TaxID=502051 RepID=A0A917Z1X1_9ALTE|nr:HAMP domain-containing sensor histidine kinase [Bowmanella pacifica]GGO72916.1 two-component sensor histidine kinase [Bowmanella pacifica]